MNLNTNIKEWMIYMKFVKELIVDLKNGITQKFKIKYLIYILGKLLPPKIQTTQNVY